MYSFRSLPTVALFGMEIVNAPRRDVIDYVLSEADAGNQIMIVTLNAEMVVRASTDNEFIIVLKSAELILPDGMGIARSAKRILHASLSVYPGVEFAYDLVNAASNQSDSGDAIGEMSKNGAVAKRHSVFLLGAKESIAQAAAESLAQRIPNAYIAGCHHGYFRGNDDAIIEMINTSGATMLLAGLGSPFQEKWLANHRARLKPRLLVGVGGSFEVWAGEKLRAPAWVNRLGLEWLYRAAIDPKRIGRLSFIPRYLALEQCEIKKRQSKV